MEYVVVFITASQSKEAKQIAGRLVAERLAACCNILGGIDSTYWWKGKVEEAKEVLLVVKTEKSKLEKVISAVKEIHSYELPEIIALPIVGGEPKYLGWIGESLGII